MARPVQRLSLRAAFSSIAGRSGTVRLNGLSSDPFGSVCSNPRTILIRDRFELVRSRSARIPEGFPSLTYSVSHPNMALSGVMKFDKVPDKLPDWWDDEDDDDEEGADRGGQDGEGRRGGGGGGEGGSGGSSGGDGGGQEGGFFAALLAAYVRAIKTNPIRTKAISTCLLALVGDYFAQRIAQRDIAEFSFDARRSASIGIWGFCFMGPVLHYWYGLLDRLFFGRYAVVGKLLSDQLLFAPLFNGAFIAGVGSLEGNPSKEVVDTVKAKLWPSMKANWTLWPAAQFVNFTIIPRTFQIVYVNCVALFWNAILTYISHDEE